MGLIPSAEQPTHASDIARNKLRTMLCSWLLTWEIYPIILVASFLRLYRLDTTAFSGDQSVLFRLAYNALHQGLLPATSNGSSISTMNPPGAIYFLMLPALFSADPLWAAAMTALFNVIAVLLTYLFTRRYYGRLAAAIAAMLYATAETSIVFSRFIWQPNLLAPFVMLFLFVLFWGVVEQRQGWLFPALFLLGVMFQFHEVTLILVVPLLVALLLAPQTIRLRDIVLAFIFLLLLFAPFLVWEITANFADLQTMLSLGRAHADLDTKALTFYARFLNSYYYDERFIGSSAYDPTGSASSIVFMLLPLLTWSSRILGLLLLSAFATAGVLVFRSQGKIRQTAAGAVLSKKQAVVFLPFAQFYGWWKSLRDNPCRSGLLVLLVWQIVPLIVLSRHTALIHQHYLLLTIPGPFILIGFFIARVILWLREREALLGCRAWLGREAWLGQAQPLHFTHSRNDRQMVASCQGDRYSGLAPARRIHGLWLQKLKPVWVRGGMRYGTYAIIVLVLCVQLMGSTASLIDTVNGINSHISGYNELGSFQNALLEADQVAQRHHLNRVYITISSYEDTLTSLPFLAEHMHTPTTLFDATNCLVLPAPDKGPAVLLVRSTTGVVTTLLRHFATAILVGQPPLLGTSPFQLFLVTPHTQPIPDRNGFVDHLQLIDAQQLSADSSSWLVARWTLLRNEQASPRTTYTYSMRAQTDFPHTGIIRSDCLLTSIRAGDQLVTTYRWPQGSVRTPSLRITAQFLVMSPYTIPLGPFHFETAVTRGMPVTLPTMDGGDAITISDASGT